MRIVMQELWASVTLRVERIAAKSWRCSILVCFRLEREESLERGSALDQSQGRYSEKKDAAVHVM